MKRAFAIALSFVVMTFVLITPAHADNPVLTFLETAVMTSLNDIRAGVAAVQSSLASLQTAVSGLQTSVNGVDARVARSARFITYHDSFFTHENAVESFQVAALPAGVPYNTVVRYTVSVQPGLLRSASSGIDRIIIFDGVVNDLGVPGDITIASIDPAGSQGLSVGPYVGANSFVNIRRGADGLGTVKISVNSVMELPND